MNINLLQTWEKARILSSIALIESGVATDEIPISVVNRVVTDINTPYDAGHSINQYNSHVIQRPPEYTFTIAIAAVSDEIELLRDIQSSGIFFKMILKDENETNREFTLCKEIFNYCKITRKRMEINVGQVPMIMFDGFALEYTYEYWDANGNATAVEENGDTYWFGHGTPIPDTLNLFANWKTPTS